MVKVEKYIRKLLFEYDCVIIPEFGGLLTHLIGAHYDIGNAVFHPATKRIAFNEVLRIDDGLLTYYISVNEKINRDEAAHHVRKFVDLLRESLKEGKTVLLDGVGSFTANNEGKAVFEPDYSQNFNEDWFGFGSVEATILNNNQEQELFQVNEVHAEQNQETGLVLITDSNPRKQWLGWVAAAVITGAIFTVSILYKPLDNSVLSTLNPVYSFKELYISGLKNLFPRKIVKPVVYIEAPVSSIRAIIPSTASKQYGDSVKTEENAVVEPLSLKTKPIETGIELNVVASGNYFLIAGSFGKMSNARILKKRLNKNGFDNAQVLANLSGKLIKVSVGNYQTMSEALQDKNKVDEITDADSWVYYYKR